MKIGRPTRLNWFAMFCTIILLCTCCLIWLGCSSEDSAEPVVEIDVSVNIPTPNLLGAEKPVIEKINQARTELASDVNSAATWGQFAMVLDAHGLYEEALISYKQAELLDPSNYHWPYFTAVILLKDDPDESDKSFKRAIELEPRSSAMRHTYADALLHAGQLQEAEDQYQEALALDANNRNAMLGLGELAMRRNELNESLALLLQAAEIEPYDSEVHDKLARLYMRMGKQELAEQEAMLVKAFPEKAAVRDPIRAKVAAEAVNSTSLIRRGLAHARNGQIRHAEAAFRQVLQSLPDNIKARLNLGAMLIKQSRTTEAIEQLRAALTIAENNAELHSNLGVALAYDKQLPMALQHIRIALDLDPNYNEAHYNLGWILQGQGKTDQALASYQRALQLNPVNVRAHNNLGNLLASRGQLDEAVLHWQDAIAYSRENPEAVFNLAVAFIQLERFGEAVALFEDGLQQDPNSLRMIAGLATLLATCPEARHRDGNKAVQLAERLVKRSQGKHLPSLNLLAAAQAEAGDFASAIRTSQQTLALATASKQAQLIQIVRSRLQLYQNRQPYHQPSKGSGLENR